MVFDGIYKKLERELHEKKKEMAAIIEDSKNAYQLRDKSQVPQPARDESIPIVCGRRTRLTPELTVDDSE